MKLLVTLLLAAPLLAATAAPLPKDDAERACWLQHTRERTRVNLREPTVVEFSNLRDGFEVRSPFSVEFAVRGMGVVPAGKKQERTGHHHILIDQRLPLDVTAAIPFNDKHRHFGKGQTSTALDLPAGKHTLRLLFADHDHKPYFVYSSEITVNVLGPRGDKTLRIDPAQRDASCTAWYQDEISRPHAAGAWVDAVNLRSGEPINSPFNLRLGVGGFGVSAKGVTVEGTGHFVIELTLGGKPVPAPDLSNGATQANLFLAPGSYVMRLRFVSSDGQRELVPAQELAVPVVAQDRL